MKEDYRMTIELPPLPYALEALEPHISRETLDFHYNKHHSAYVKKTNELVKDTPHAGKSLEELVRTVEPGPLFNNAAQVWNHAFYWHSMSPQKTSLSGKLAEAIQRDFGSEEEFRKVFSQAAMGRFGSGWAWLVKDGGGKLSVVSTPNADNPLRDGKQPLLTCDVWEHAYYIDYRNARDRYVEAFWNVVNWDFAARNYGANEVELPRDEGLRKTG
jgi:Fe-Mn family superoxide dismutase